ncbi:MAG: hypothetical protein JSV30_07185 [Candidatus Omnitrophota bacterium]|nr:MAG: hypothetical protein JSV30_07185 [Candidatus Omnitrophota bacterium]
MCTIGYHKALNLIFKNRDKSEITTEEMVAEDNYIAFRTKGADYFSCGVNRYECGFVSAAVNTPQWTDLIYKGKVQQANQQLKVEKRGLSNPMILVSEMLSRARKIKAIIDKIESSELSWQGYNILLVDSGQASLIETYNSDIRIRELRPREVITNYFSLLDFGPKDYSEYPSSFRRHEYGNNNIKSAASVNDLFELLKPADENKRKKIWRRGAFKTISSSIIDLKRRLIYYSKDINEDYSIFRMH